MLAGNDSCRRQSGSAVPIFEYKPEGEVAGDFYAENLSSFKEWYAAHQPDVLIDGGYLGSWWLADMGLKAPADIGLLILRRPSRKSADKISSIDHHLQEQGRWAVDLLYNMIQTGTRGLPDKVIRITVGCELHVGETLRAVEDSAGKPAGAAAGA
jgi:DNA-binding LacI/PurR family transcriptional regulator